MQIRHTNSPILSPQPISFHFSTRKISSKSPLFFFQIMHFIKASFSNKVPPPHSRTTDLSSKVRQISPVPFLLTLSSPSHPRRRETEHIKQQENADTYVLWELCPSRICLLMELFLRNIYIKQSPTRFSFVLGDC